MPRLATSKSVRRKRPTHSRSRVTLSAIVSLGGFVVFVLLWLATALVAVTEPNGMSAFAVGYAHDDAWLVNAVIHPDGTVVIRYFGENLTYHTGPYAKLSDSRSRRPFTVQSLRPRMYPRPFARVWSIHLALPVALFAGATLLTVVRPWSRRRRRARLGLCQECGYDLHGNKSGTCPECGTVV